MNMKITTLFLACKHFVINAVRFVAEPVALRFPLFLLFYSLLFLLDIFFEGGFPLLTPFFKIVYGIFICYLLILPSYWLPKVLRRIYETVTITVSVLLVVVDVYLALILGKTFGTLPEDSIGAFLATNPQETVEFINAYFSFGKVLVVLLSLVLLFFANYKLRKVHIGWGRFSKCAFFLVIVFSSLFSISPLVDEGLLFIPFSENTPDVTMLHVTMLQIMS